LAWSEAGAVAFVTESTSISAKVSFDGCGSLDVVSAALKGRIQSSKEIVQMCCKDTDCLLQCCCGPSHDQSEGKHRPCKQLDGDLEDDEMGLLATVVLGESVNECEEKSLGENHGSKNQASNDLLPVSMSETENYSKQPRDELLSRCRKHEPPYVNWMYHESFLIVATTMPAPHMDPRLILRMMDPYVPQG